MGTKKLNNGGIYFDNFKLFKISFDAPCFKYPKLIHWGGHSGSIVNFTKYFLEPFLLTSESKTLEISKTFGIVTGVNSFS